MTTLRRARGFSLAELTVVLAITGIAMAIVLGTFQAQQRSFEAIEVGRAAQDASRDATLEIERTLRLAGFGIDPRFAFDFAHYACPDVPCRDAIDAPDELVFMARDPGYRLDPPNPPAGNAWALTAVASNVVILSARAGDVFREGQVLQLMCDGASDGVMVTVAATTAALTAPSLVNVTIDAAVADDPYNGDPATLSCLSAGNALAFKVNRYRYFVDASLPVPWLMLDQGLLDASGAPELLPIASGVEDLQVAYLFGRSPNFNPPDGDQSGLTGDQPGIVEEPDPTLTAPAYQTINEDPLRFNLHPANIRAVRVNLVVRSQRPDPGPVPGWAGDDFPLLENRDAFVEYAPDTRPDISGVQHRLRRHAARTIVQTRNMGSKALFLF